MKEINYKGILVKVSENGDVYTPDREVVKRNGVWKVKECKLIQVKDKDGYMRLRLNGNGKRYGVLVHRLVAMAYIPNPENLPCVNHKDEDKANNHYTNLEWCSVDYNNKYNDRYSKIKRKTKSVGQYADGNLVAKFDSIKDAAIAVKGHCSNIGNCCNGRLLTAYGYDWKFLNDNR
jgi:hypothetical protein